MLNRLILLIFAVFLIAASLVLVLISVGWTTPLDVLNTVYNDMHARIVFGVSGGFVLIFGLYLLLITLFKQPEDHTVVENTSLGEINISLRAVENMLQQAATSINGIKEIRPYIRNDEKGVFIFLKAIIGPEVNIPNASKELQEKSRSVLENAAGIKVNEVKVNVIDVQQGAKGRVR